MKGFNLAERQQQAKDAEGWVKSQPCIVCGKVIGGAYGAWSRGWTCSKSCNSAYGGQHVHDQQPRREDVRVGVAPLPLLLPDAQ